VVPGELFLVHRFEGQVGDGAAGCIEIIGYDAQSQSYPTHTFYHNGLANEWHSHECYGTWTLAGDWNMQGKSVKVRCTTAFSDAGHTMRSKWEQSATARVGRRSGTSKHRRCHEPQSRIWIDHKKAVIVSASADAAVSVALLMN
jgi:hypothetical protein